MILGIGTDIVEVSRIKTLIEKNGDSFIQKIFSDDEIKLASEKKSNEIFLAGRWAVKEAFAKALGYGIGPICGWKNITTLNNKDGKPYIILSGNAKKTTENMGNPVIHVSISHEKDYAVAYVIIEKNEDYNQREAILRLNTERTLS